MYMHAVNKGARFRPNGGCAEWFPLFEGDLIDVSTDDDRVVSGNSWLWLGADEG